MVNSSSSSSPKKKRYILSIVTFIFLFLFAFFVFTKRALDPTLSLYKNHLYPIQTPQPPHSDSETQIDEFNTSHISQDPHSDSNNKNVDDDDDTKNLISDFDDTKNETDFGGEEEKEKKENLIISDSESGSTLNVESSNGSSIEVEVEVEVERLRSCDMYNGKWVKDEENNNNKHPIYKPGTCPYVDEAYDCNPNGRKDTDYLQWRWKPNDCDLPRFNATDFLTRLRGKRFMLVGDSMNRNQFESLLCLIREGLPNKSKMYEVHGYKITKGRGYYIFKFEDYDCTVEFVRSHFLVREGIRLGGRGNSNPTLSIDRIDKSAPRWKRADILVFNTGHWWAHGKTARGKNYYKEGDYIYPHFDAVEAYRRALKTWAKWIDENVNPSKLVFYRGYSSAHFRGGDWDSGGTCNGETEPIQSGAFLDNYPLKMKIVDEILGEMRVPVVALNVTRLTNFRKDGHPSVYGKNVTGMKKVSTRRQDCSHWCLPGVPDAWNELIYATLVLRTASSLPNHPS